MAQVAQAESIRGINQYSGRLALRKIGLESPVSMDWWEDTEEGTLQLEEDTLSKETEEESTEDEYWW